MTPITLAIPAYNAGFDGCHYCNFIWTRAGMTHLEVGSLYECAHCGKEYMQVNEDKGLTWEPTMTVLRGKR